MPKSIGCRREIMLNGRYTISTGSEVCRVWTFSGWPRVLSRSNNTLSSMSFSLHYHFAAGQTLEETYYCWKMSTVTHAFFLSFQTMGRCSLENPFIAWGDKQVVNNHGLDFEITWRITTQQEFKAIFGSLEPWFMPLFLRDECARWHTFPKGPILSTMKTSWVGYLPWSTITFRVLSYSCTACSSVLIASPDTHTVQVTDTLKFLETTSTGLKSLCHRSLAFLFHSCK